MSELEELEYDYERGRLSKDDVQLYQRLHLQKELHHQKKKIEFEDRNTLLNNQLTSKDSGLFARKNIKNSTVEQESSDSDEAESEEDIHFDTDSILQKYFHPVEHFMIDNAEFFHQD